MGPQLYRCGNLKEISERAEGIDASMGPQLYRCGNDPAAGPVALGMLALQWGRNFIVAEIGRTYG